MALRKPGGHNTLDRVTRRIATLPWALPWVLMFSLALVSFAPPAAAQRRTLPPEIEKLYAPDQKPVIELVTMGVGSLIWERHGHIALCVRYADPREDACYNYGIGDFHHPLDMAWGFFRATGAFWVGKMNPREMLSIYQYADRTIWVQPLPLTPEQKQKIIAKLEDDILEEHKHYAYDHFWDNCTTRVRDILDDATGGSLRAMTEPTDGKTYRDLAREGFLGMRVASLITDLAMGRVTDRVPSYYERMFLPDYLREAAIKRWGIQPIAIYERKGKPALKELEKRLADPNLPAAERADYEAQKAELESSPSGRILFCLLILALTAPAWATRLWGKFQRTGLAVAVIPVVLFGTIFWLLSIISPLPYIRWNETCLALMPFDLLLLLLPEAKRKRYAQGRVAMLGLVAALLLINVFKAPIWPALLWAIIPNAVVAFLPRKASPEAAAATTSAKPPANGKPKRAA